MYGLPYRLELCDGATRLETPLSKVLAMLARLNATCRRSYLENSQVALYTDDAHDR